MPLTPKQFLLLWTAGAIVMFGTVVGMRWLQRRPFFKPHFDGVEFDENWCSGASSAGLMGELGWARNCLWIVVARGQLHVGAHFPFNLFLPRFLLGLDLSVPITSVISVETMRSSWTGEHVKVSYSVTDDARGIISTRYITVQCKRSDRFTGILREGIAAIRPRRAV